MIVGQPWMRLLLPVDGGPVCPPPDNARVAGDGMIIFLPGMACVLILTYLSNHMITCWKQGCVSRFGFMGLAPTPGRRESMRCGLQKANDVWMRRAPKADGTPCIPSMFSFTFFVMPRMRLVSRCAAHLRMSPERRTAVMALQGPAFEALVRMFALTNVKQCTNIMIYVISQFPEPGWTGPSERRWFFGNCDRFME